MSAAPTHVETDVLIIGSGGAGMYAAIEAARAGCGVLLADRSLIGRGGATVMAQMTVAAALGQQEPDAWSIHLEDTLKAGRGLCNQELSALLCREGPERIESGWWDERDVGRDYYTAVSSIGQRLWIYKDRCSRNWHLHGLFG